MKSNKSNFLIGTLFRRLLLQVSILSLVLLGALVVSDTIIQRTPTFYETSGWLYYRTLYLAFLFVVIWCLGVVTLTYRTLRRAASYVNELYQATTQLFDEDIDVISLSPEFGDIGTSLNKLKQEAHRNAQAAREAEQRKNDLIMYLAHDLKTPLSSVIGYLTLLADEPSLPAEVRQRYLHTTRAKAERLDGLINEFFEITRFNLAHMPLEYHTIDGARLLEQLVFEFQPQLAEKHLHCDLHTPETLPLRCDPDKLQRVFDNLLRNAVLYSDPGTTLTIAVRKEPTNAVFSFTNAGATIPPERLAHLFDQFFRLDTARSSSGGAGLGLAIARQIVRQHGGDITAASASGTVTFTVILPLDPS